MTRSKHKYGAVALLLACYCHATTVVLFVQPAGIVIGSDSKGTLAGKFTPVNSEAIRRTKIFVVQKRIVIAVLGLAHVEIPKGKVAYDFPTWIDKVSQNLPTNISVSQLASVIESKSQQTFSGFDQAIIKTHTLPRPFLNPFINLLIYIIAGYENGEPSIFAVQFHVDWTHETLIGPIKSDFHSADSPAGKYYVATLGHDNAISDYENQESYAYKQCLTRSPKTFAKMLASEPITVPEAQRIAQVLIDIEEQVEPNTVGGDIQLGTILPSGVASIKIIEKRVLPKAHAKK